MIAGPVTSNLEARVDIDLVWKGTRLSVSAIVDTGFSEFLTLPTPIIAGLSLPYYDTALIRLANGAIESVEVFQAHCQWDGVRRTIYVQAADGDILCGMQLLNGRTLTIHVEDGGEVSIE